jgi:hypothetical protein
MSGQERRLSIGQQELWLLYRLAPDSAAYNDAAAATFTPGLDVDGLRRAVAAVVARHDILRSRFVELDDRVVRVVEESALVAVDVRDARGVGDGELLASARRIAAEPFQLSETGPFRLVLLRRDADCALVVVTHHIATDAHSQRIVWRDLAEAYRACVLGIEPAWPPLRTSFDDYVRKEQELLDSPRSAELAGYWREVAAGARAATLPTDHPRVRRLAFNGATCRRRLDDELVRQVRAAAAETGTTQFTVLVGVFAALLHRYTGQADLTVGCPTSVRRGAALRHVVGLLVNTILLRTRFTGETTFAEVIAATAGQLGAGIPRSRYPFGLVNAARTENDPLFRIAVTMVAPTLGDKVPLVGDGPVGLVGHTVAMLDVPHLEGQFDLTVEFTWSPTSGAVVFRYDRDLFAEATVDSLLDRFVAMLAVACARPHTRVSRAPLIGEAERQELLALGAAVL